MRQSIAIIFLNESSKTFSFHDGFSPCCHINLSLLTYSCRRRGTFACIIKPHVLCAHLGTGWYHRPTSGEEAPLSAAKWPHPTGLGLSWVVVPGPVRTESTEDVHGVRATAAVSAEQGSVRVSPRRERFPEESCFSLTASVTLLGRLEECYFLIIKVWGPSTRSVFFLISLLFTHVYVLGGSPGEGDGYPLQYSCLGNPMDRGARRATVAKSRTRLRD